MTLMPTGKVYREMLPFPGPSMMHKVSWQSGRYGIEVLNDFVSGDGSKSWVVIGRGLQRYVTEISANGKQYIFAETATRQDAGSGSERSAADVSFATRSKVKSPTRS